MDHQRAPIRHWGLDRWPFGSVPSAAQFYPTAGHEEALARIEYLVDARRRLGLLAGGSGYGKSMLLSVAASRLARRGNAVVTVDATGLSTREFLWQLAAGLRASPLNDADSPRLWRQIADRLTENRLQEVGTVLFLDEVGLAGPDVLTQFARLARLDASPAARWTLILAAESQHISRWNETLRELVDLRIDVEPWEQGETVGFLQTALVEAGSTGPLFDDLALITLHELSGGVPRRVARLADYALLAGAEANSDHVTADLVRAAYEEIAWPQLEAAY
jgi:type II secretory pathway predicted ATPase ExeA